MFWFWLRCPKRGKRIADAGRVLQYVVLRNRKGAEARQTNSRQPSPKGAEKDREDRETRKDRVKDRVAKKRMAKSGATSGATLSPLNS